MKRVAVLPSARRAIRIGGACVMVALCLAGGSRCRHYKTAS